jgi:uncharacterized protein
MRFILSWALAACAASAAAASFDCAKAQSRIEKAVCADKELSQLDEHLGQYYAGARATLGPSAACLAADQRQWLRKRDGCADAACLRRAYLERLGELHALQPGATAIRYFELPSVPSLWWIVPPEFPGKKAGAPLVATGRVVDEIADGDGYVLVTAEGRRHLLVPLILLGGETQARLAGLANDSSPVRARGSASEHAGRISYDMNQCVFLYRLP